MNKLKRLGKPVRILMLVTIVIILCSFFITAYEDDGAAGIADLEVSDETGKVRKVSEFKSTALLIGFIQAHDSGEAESMKDMRSQLNYLISMKRQHTDDGLQVVMVESGNRSNGIKTSRDTILNFHADWLAKDNIPLLINSTQTQDITNVLGVKQYPTVLLMDKDLRVIERWESLVLPAQLDFAINRLIDDISSDQLVTAASARFVGFPLARHLGNDIWIIDGGMDWIQGKYPIRLLVLKDERVEINKIEIQLMAHTKGSNNKIRMKVGKPLWLPEEESKVVLHHLDDKGKSALMVDVEVQLNDTGFYDIFADVRFGESINVQGNAIIVVK